VWKCVRKRALNYSAGCPSGNISRFFLTKFAKVSDQRTLARKSFVLIGRPREKRKDYGSVAHQFFHIHREGWPLLTVETEANGDSRSTYERGKGVLHWLGSLCRYNTFLSCLGCSRPSTIYYFPHHTLFHFLSPHCPATWGGNRAASLRLPAIGELKGQVKSLFYFRKFPNVSVL
jgi:hypothetical protein